MRTLLICSTPVHGHVTPLLVVARHLTNVGHRVKFLTGRRFADQVRQTGAEFIALPAEADYDDRDMNASFPGRIGRTGIDGIRWDVANIFLKPAAAQIAAVDDVVATEHIDAILLENMFIGAAGLLRRPRYARPAVITLGIVPLGVHSVDTAPMGLGLLPMPGPLGRARNAALQFVTERFIFGGVQRQAESIIRDATGEDLDGFFMNGASHADAIVQFTVPGFEYERSDLPDTVHFVGPMSKASTSDISLPEWWDDLDGSRPVVHVTQGTIANADYDELIMPTINALAADDVTVVVSTGGRDISTLPPSLPDNVRVASYLPYDLLLPLTDVFVSNGGYGGVHQALEHGVPLVVAGTTEDKAEVSARVQWTGVGVNLRTNTPSVKAVGTAVRRVLREPAFAERATAMSCEIAASSGLPGLDAVIDALAPVND